MKWSTVGGVDSPMDAFFIVLSVASFENHKMQKVPLFTVTLTNIRLNLDLTKNSYCF